MINSQGCCWQIRYFIWQCVLVALPEAKKKKNTKQNTNSRSSSKINSIKYSTWRRIMRLHVPFNLIKSLSVRAYPWYKRQEGFREKKRVRTIYCKQESTRTPSCLFSKVCVRDGNSGLLSFGDIPVTQARGREETCMPFQPSNYSPCLRDEDICE